MAARRAQLRATNASVVSVGDLPTWLWSLVTLGGQARARGSNRLKVMVYFASLSRCDAFHLLTSRLAVSTLQCLAATEIQRIPKSEGLRWAAERQQIMRFSRCN
jgi:hypothetical protein